MKLWIISLLLFFSLSWMSAQESSFLSLRYNEDYQNLRGDTTENWYHKMKFQRIGHNSSFLSQGGEVRYQFQHLTNEDWGDASVSSYNSFYTRFLYHSDFHVAEFFRLFTQLNSTFAVGRIEPNRAIDENQLDVQQVFFELKPGANLTLRIGRQEFLYGSQRLIAVREGPNNRQSYDAAKAIFKFDRGQLDAYYSHPVRVRRGILDDRFNQQEKLWSLYSTINPLQFGSNFDLYYIGYSHSNKSYNAGTAPELRHSIGTRIWKKSASWNYDFEALYQFGNFGAQNIHAYTASIDASYRFDQQRFSPTLGLKTEIISGDKSPDDNQLNTFNPLFPRGAYFGLAALIGPLNLIDFHPSFSFEPSSKLGISLDYDVFWRYSIRDGIYGPSVVLIYGDGGNEHFIGHQLGLSLEYQPNKFLKITPEIMWFEPGAYLDEVSPGKEVWFAAFTVQFKF